LVSQPSLAPLSTRASDDYAISLLELWAVVADVLTFYQERIANESYLGTATLRESIGRLVRLIDYQLRPALAATARLAFTLERVTAMTIPAALRVQSVPGPNEKPQKFETIESLNAVIELNRVPAFGKLEPTNPFAQGSTGGTTQALVSGRGLAAGDTVVLFDDTRAERKVLTSVARGDDDRLTLGWAPPVLASDFNQSQAQIARVKRTMHLFASDAPLSYVVPHNKTDSTGNYPLPIIQVDVVDLSGDFSLGAGSTGVSSLALDATYRDLVRGSSVLIDRSPTSSGDSNAFTLTATVTGAVASQERFPVAVGTTPDPPAVAATVTRITLDNSTPFIDDLRQVLVHELADAPLALRGWKYPSTISGAAVYVPLRDVDMIDRKRELLLDDGTPSPVAATVASAAAIDADGDGALDHLEISLTAPLSRSLDGLTTVLFGNVTLASHGETVKPEVLGSADATLAFQKFSLSKQPVTYLSGATGPTSTLDLRVDNIAWTEVPTLYAQHADAQVFVSRLRDDGTMVVEFGDGEHGARPPTGVNNVVARYRQGAGLAGRVRAGTLTNLLDRPVGLRAVTNLLPAEGGDDAELPDDARRNAPTRVKTFGRAVSLRDIEELATAAGEIAKASATLVWNRDAQAVFLTVAAAAGEVPGTDVLDRVRAQLDAARDPNQPLIIAPFVRVPIVIKATLHVDAKHVASIVAAAARDATIAALSFDALAFGQTINRSDIYAILQGVDGVEYVDIDELQFKNASSMTAAEQAERGMITGPLQERLRIFGARSSFPPLSGLSAAEQAVLDDPDSDLLLTTSGGLAD